MIVGVCIERCEKSEEMLTWSRMGVWPSCSWTDDDKNNCCLAIDPNTRGEEIPMIVSWSNDVIMIPGQLFLVLEEKMRGTHRTFTFYCILCIFLQPSPLDHTFKPNRQSASRQYR